MPPTVRRAEESDLPELKRMRVALDQLLEERDPKVWRLSQEMQNRLESFYAEVMAKETNRIFVATDNRDRPVGMLMVRIIDNPNVNLRPFGRIDDAWVEPAHRRQGVMKALTRAATDFLVERSVPMVMLDWADKNIPSVHCWQTLGFEPLVTMGFAAPAEVSARCREGTEP